MNYLELAFEVKDYVKNHRNYLHQNPELTGKEWGTLQYIKNELRYLGIPYEEVENGGIIGRIQGTKGKGHKIVLRADIDALPIQESEYNLLKEKTSVSRTENVSHMCGHDAHTAMLLGCAKVLKENIDKYSGEILLLFERGEELGFAVFPLLRYFEKNHPDISAMFATHVKADIDEGKFSAEPGFVMSGFIVYDVLLTGKGGHSSRPDKCNNPLDCFTNIYQNIEQIRMRYVPPEAYLTNSISYVQCGTKSNVIPETCQFSGMTRFYNDTYAKPFRRELENVIEKNAEMFHCDYQYGYIMGPTPGLYNNPSLSSHVKQSLIKALGSEAVIQGEPWMASESVSYYYLKYPGIMTFMGIRNEKEGYGADNHNIHFDLNPDSLYLGVAATLSYAVDYLNGDIPIEFKSTDLSIEDLEKTRS